MVFPGHLGTIYRATNAIYTGLATARTLRLLPDGRVQVSWPGDGEGWRLQAATRLGATADWQAITAPGATSYADTTDRAMRLFRLLRP